MSEWNKMEFAEALSTRYMRLTVLSDATNSLIEEADRQKAEEELHLLRTVILNLPKDILDLVRQRISL
ncbi:MULTISPECIES: hypothetical protein [Paenibacillus]|uniref:hypothetical protein n=1 Tax=Paenibacillus TaxID=44249 RepID=UPI00096FFBC4|nr:MULTISPECIES: hypothetical protein [Paenibacillus]OMD26821.1 hypothetical protein BJP48_21880 [Paenibacillus odorifer]OMF89806.1 hypothetical protein BK147_24840 [Paenibacillus sp. FSL R7-0337]